MAKVVIMGKPLGFHEITNGPSKLDLMLGLFDSSNEHPRPVKFHIQDNKEGYDIEVGILGVQKEDGSGESWNIEGYTNQIPNVHRVHIYFSTRSRAGTLWPVSR